jgi:hypothetical protein
LAKVRIRFGTIPILAFTPSSNSLAFPVASLGSIAFSLGIFVSPPDSFVVVIGSFNLSALCLAVEPFALRLVVWHSLCRRLKMDSSGW